MKPRSISFADTVARLETEFVDALLKAVRECALAALDDVLSSAPGVFRSIDLVDASESREVREARPARAPSRPKARPASRRTERSSARKRESEHLANGFTTFSDDDDLLTAKDEAAFVITDPSVVLAEVAALEEPAPEAPLRRLRRVRSGVTSRLVEVPALPSEDGGSSSEASDSSGSPGSLDASESAHEEEPASTAPALRDGEEVARAVVGGGVVLRRRRG
ncbi:hypothetical protein [Pendulispora albinea]|uniref:Uncharacterized protein n=1 Tax=Pendulispora albinea TaxID=2741071 RepID=A0ABZ2M6N9_9BACT